jgi:hypothetical protein
MPFQSTTQTQLPIRCAFPSRCADSRQPGAATRGVFHVASQWPDRESPVAGQSDLSCHIHQHDTRLPLQWVTSVCRCDMRWDFVSVGINQRITLAGTNVTITVGPLVRGRRSEAFLCFGDTMLDSLTVIFSMGGCPCARTQTTLRSGTGLSTFTTGLH